MRRQLTRRREAGYATIETAAALPVLVLFLTAGLIAISAMTHQAQCVDTARDVALSIARGDTPQAARAGTTVEVSTDVDSVTVIVTAPIIMGGIFDQLTVTGTATAPREPGT